VVVTPAAFTLSLSNAEPADALSAPLAALWWAKKGNWDKAHRLVQDESGAEAAWVHAYLHRVEGDLGNARYWYAQARKPAASSDLDVEWAAIVEALLRETVQGTQ
jgi:hypothetical protein